jgi:predicted dehydrogenase
MTEGPRHRNLIEFHGSEGSMRIEDRGEIFLAKQGDTDWTEVSVEPTQMADGMPDTGFPIGFMHFAPKIVDAIAAGRTEIEDAATFEDGHQVQKVLDAARESDAEGKVVNLL